MHEHGPYESSEADETVMPLFALLFHFPSIARTRVEHGFLHECRWKGTGQVPEVKYGGTKDACGRTDNQHNSGLSCGHVGDHLRCAILQL